MQVICVMLILLGPTKSKLKSVALVRPANYTDRATAACRRSYCQILADIGCRVVSTTDPHGHNLGFLDRSRYFSIQVAPQLLEPTNALNVRPRHVVSFEHWGKKIPSRWRLSLALQQKIFQ
jgi:hypothetical protein